MTTKRTHGPCTCLAGNPPLSTGPHTPDCPSLYPAQERMANDNARIEALEAEVYRLRQEVEHRLDEMNLQARWTREAQEKVDRLKAALRPFAEAAKRLGHMSDEGAAFVSVADLRSALKHVDGT